MWPYLMLPRCLCGCPYRDWGYFCCSLWYILVGFVGGCLGGFFDDISTKVFVVTFGCDVGLRGTYLAMDTFIICWLSWSIFVCSEVVFASLEFICLLFWELESVRLEISMLDVFFAAEKYEAAVLMMDISSSIVVTVA